MSATLLVELLTEELPPRALPALGACFSREIAQGLHAHGFVLTAEKYRTYATPRRLAVQLPQVAAVQAERRIEKKGPALAAGYQNGQPTPALLGFARSVGLTADQLDQLETALDGKQQVYVFRRTQAGEPLARHLAGIVAQALKKLPIPKTMRWGSSEVQFVRPVHGLVMLHGSAVVPGEVLGLRAGRETRGHRFLHASGTDGAAGLPIVQADQYEATLEKAHVVASFDTRQARIAKALETAARLPDAALSRYPFSADLLAEVSALVEWPVVLEGHFDTAFLAVPQECLMLTMQRNQKYFPLRDENGQLLPRYLIVSNLASQDPARIVQGNNRVLRARLSDAQFFYQQDGRHTLESRLPRLAQVIYHNRLGSQLERLDRLERLTVRIAQAMNLAGHAVDESAARRAAQLAKADLLTEMVGEFPELQGTMGAIYARRQHEAEAVAAALDEHYRPRFAGDALPQGAVAQALALADKLETLVGIWGIGQVPSGDKDPFALRRAALGVVRILLEGALPLDLQCLLGWASETFPPGTLSADTVAGVSDFLRERLRGVLKDRCTREGWPPSLAEAVLSDAPGPLHDLPAQLAALDRFVTQPEAARLIAVHKRIHNLIHRPRPDKGGAGKNRATHPAGTTENTTAPQAGAYTETAEHALHEAWQQLLPRVSAAAARQDYDAVLATVGDLAGPIDRFFDEVMVMSEDPAIRHNRLALLREVSTLLTRGGRLEQL